MEEYLVDALVILTVQIIVIVIWMRDNVEIHVNIKNAVLMQYVMQPIIKQFVNV